MGKKPVVWPVRSTAWFGWERPVSRGGVLLLPRPCPLVDHPTSCPYSRRYLITSSARNRSVGGMVIPSAWAVLRLRTKLELRRLLHGQVGGFSAFQELVHIGGGTEEQRHPVLPIGHEATGVHIVPVGVHPWEPVPLR